MSRVIRCESYESLVTAMGMIALQGLYWRSTAKARAKLSPSVASEPG